MDFEFSHVDALTTVPASQVASAFQRLAPLHARGFGAIVEYEYIRRQSAFAHLPALTELTDAPLVRAVENTLHATPSLQIATITAQPFEIASLPTEITHNVTWSAFLRRLVDAAKRSGFHDSNAKAFGGAFGELVDNAIDHSERPSSACIAYRWIEREFEMVIADAGIGIRASLQNNPKHCGLHDDQIALEQALTMGISRYPDGSGHGTGFRTVFDALAGLGGLLRFRSGVAALLLDGAQFNSLRRKVLQRDHFQGFVATICCRT